MAKITFRGLNYIATFNKKLKSYPSLLVCTVNFDLAYRFSEEFEKNLY